MCISKAKECMWSRSSENWIAQPECQEWCGNCLFLVVRNKGICLYNKAGDRSEGCQKRNTCGWRNRQSGALNRWRLGLLSAESWAQGSNYQPQGIQLWKMVPKGREKRRRRPESVERAIAEYLRWPKNHHQGSWRSLTMTPNSAAIKVGSPGSEASPWTQS